MLQFVGSFFSSPILVKRKSSKFTLRKPLPLGMGSVKDDFMFCKVMQNNPDLCKHLIELIIGKKITLIQQKI